VLAIRELDGKYCVSLLVTNGLRGKYVILSHCWGAKPVIRVIVTMYRIFNAGRKQID
jgi:hypothetical protein